MGSGPCLATCGPILISYIAATKKTPLGGLWSWFVFTASRFFITVFLGLLAGIAGSELFRRFYWENPGYAIWLFGGIFIAFLGLLIILGKHTHINLCSKLNQSLIEHDTKSLITLGIVVGILPCLPIIGIFSYITMASTHYSQGVLMSAAFGLGAAISPLLILSMLTGYIPKLKPLQNEKTLRLFQRICGGILFLLGVHIISRTVMEYMGAL